MTSLALKYGLARCLKAYLRGIFQCDNDLIHMRDK